METAFVNYYETKDRKQNDEFILTIDQQTELRKRLMHVYDTVDLTKPVIETETREDIRLAVNSGVKELFDLGCIVTMTVVKPHYSKLAIKYQDPPRTMVEDLVNTPLFETIRDNIKKYNAKYTLITYFEKPVTAAFMKAREQGRGEVLTKYYMDMSVIIKRAERELSGLGITDISDMDLSMWIKTKYGKDISATTIGKINNMNKKVTSINGPAIKPIADQLVEDPAVILERRESQEEFYKGIEALSDYHNLFMKAALKYIERTGNVPKTPAQAHKICKKIIPNITKRQAMSLMRSSFFEFKRSYRGCYQEDEENRSSVGECMIDDILIMEEESNLRTNTTSNNVFFDDDRAEEMIVLDEE